MEQQCDEKVCSRIILKAKTFFVCIWQFVFVHKKNCHLITKEKVIGSSFGKSFHLESFYFESLTKQQPIFVHTNFVLVFFSVICSESTQSQTQK